MPMLVIFSSLLGDQHSILLPGLFQLPPCHHVFQDFGQFVLWVIWRKHVFPMPVENVCHLQQVQSGHAHVGVLQGEVGHVQICGQLGRNGILCLFHPTTRPLRGTHHFHELLVQHVTGEVPDLIADLSRLRFFFGSLANFGWELCLKHLLVHRSLEYLRQSLHVVEHPIQQQFSDVQTVKVTLTFRSILPVHVILKDPLSDLEHHQAKGWRLQSFQDARQNVPQHQ
mmetsp:Transcript_39536/g.80874  ORF Transcript_39536/g.80874 Transcript_39536/m.80874 type:complete len:226 (-) Transcript_39536:453-1130(-)